MAKLRQVWRESETVFRDTMSFLEDQEQIAFPLSRIAEVKEWNNPLPLARLAVAFNPNNPWNRLTLSANLIRFGEGDFAIKELDAAIESASRVRGLLPRVLRNRAGAAERQGDFTGAVQFARKALIASKFSETYILDYLGYSVSYGRPENILEATQAIKKYSRQVSSQSRLTGFLYRPGTPCNYKLRADDGVAGLINKEFGNDVKSPILIGVGAT